SNSGDYSINVSDANILPVNQDNPDDTFVFLYSSFSPSSPLDGLIMANDDISETNFKSKINSVALTGGVTYTIVMTSYDVNATGSVTFEVMGPGAVDVGTANTLPVASSVSITGTPTVGQTLTGTYTYTDADSDIENG